MQPQYSERAILVGVDQTGRKRRTPTQAEGLDTTAEESLDELVVLAESAGAAVVQTTLQSRPTADAATVVGSGKVEEIANDVRHHEAGVVIFDSDLSPTQQRNLEKALDCKVIDRTQLILDIFARRARTREGQLQVELAQLNYLLPRLTGQGTSLSRLGGGIGTRGPGETKLETDRRRIFMRLKRLEDELESVRGVRKIQRRQRQAVPLITVGLVGYTNAGKSTLFNRLTHSGVVADARMFATLDPTVRQFTLPSRRRVLLSDTVGFIRNLPTTLVKAFRATLEEVVEASLLLHVVDASAEHAAHQTAHVMRVVGEIGAGTTPQLLVLNKADRLPPDGTSAEEAATRILAQVGPTEGDPSLRPEVNVRAVAVSALTGQGMDDLLRTIDELLPADPVAHGLFRFPLHEGAIAHHLHEYARVLATRHTEEFTEIEAEAPESVRRALSDYLVEP